MPTYEYECTRGHRFEVVQRITEDPLKRCQVCRSKAHRLISASAFILKGGGWYSDGYSSSAGNGSKADSAADSPKDSKSSKDSTSSKDSKSSKDSTSSASDAKSSSKTGDSSE